MSDNGIHHETTASLAGIQRSTGCLLNDQNLHNVSCVYRADKYGVLIYLHHAARFLPKCPTNNQNEIVRKRLLDLKRTRNCIVHTVLIALNVRACLSMQGDRMKPLFNACRATTTLSASKSEHHMGGPPFRCA